MYLIMPLLNGKTKIKDTYSNNDQEKSNIEYKVSKSMF